MANSSIIGKSKKKIIKEFIKNPDETVAKFLGEGKVLSMVRFQVGEGMEKREENFAEEVAAQMNQ